jgi:tetratricopeptide (TPR) repeat protein
MRILTFCQALAVTVLLSVPAHAADTAEQHYLRGVEYGEAAQHANIFKKAGLARKAQAEFERAIEIDPNFLDARFALVEYYLRAPALLGGSDAKAVAEAGEIRRRNSVEGHHAFGRIFLHQKKYVEAAREYEHAVAADANFMDGWFEIGYIAAVTGTNLERGEEALRKYLAYTPARNEPPAYRAHYWLGAIFEKQGKKTDAKASYANSLRANPDQKDVQEAMKRVS